MADDDASPDAPSAIRFRAGRKRKAYRQRANTDGDGDNGNTNNNGSSSRPAPADVLPSPASRAARDDDDDDDDDDDNENNDENNDNMTTTGGAQDGQESAVAAAMRLRNARKAGRLRGVNFKADARAGDGAAEEQALVLRDQQQHGDRDVAVPGIADHFMHQTGLLTNLNDEHMTAYIESRLSSRNAALTGSFGARPGVQHPLAAAPTDAAPQDPSAPYKMANQPTRQGKLLEVDVPAFQPRRGAKRPADDAPAAAAGDGAAGPAKPSRRQRNRRNSDDIKRDKLVEEFLHENRLDVYDLPDPATHNRFATGDGDADDRLAEQFRQQYLDEAAARRRKKRAPAQTRQQSQQQPATDVLKGPKLGGSRNARAAVRDALLQKQQERGRPGRP